MTTVTWMVRNLNNRYTIEEITEEIGEAGIRAEKSKLVQSITKRLTIDTNEKLPEWIQKHPPEKVPLNVSDRPTWILTSRGLWITVHHCAKRKRTSIICVVNVPSLRWKITSKVHKIRTTLKRKSTFQRASGNRCLHDAGKAPASSGSGGSGGSSKPVSIHPRTKSNYRKGKNPSRRQN